MTRKLTVAAIQMTSELGNKEGNWEKAVELTAEAKRQGAQTVCFPELFLQGYTLKRNEFVKLSETQTQIEERLKHVAQDLGVYLIIPYAEQGDIPGVVYNSAAVWTPEGNVVGNMRKVYLWGEEKLKFRPGSNFAVFDTAWGKMAILICYDAEFPEPPRIVGMQGAELVFVPSVWSVAASNRWHVDLAAAALYNQYFVVGVNTIGNGICGRSKIVNPRGETIAEASENLEEVLCATIDLDEVAAYRSEVPYWNDMKTELFSTLTALENY